MANIRKRGTKWQAQVRRQGHPPLTRSFTLKADAEAWARQREVEIERGDKAPVDRRALAAVTLGQLLSRYVTEVSPGKKGRVPEVCRLQAMLRHPIANTPLDRLTTSTLAAYRDRRLMVVSSGSVRRELTLLRHCLRVAMREWSVSLPFNPLDSLDIPQDSRPRTRRATKEELQNLAAALEKTRNKLVVGIINMAIATGMRRSEILAVTWGDADLSRRTIHLRDTKNGSPRCVPLSPMALKVLQSLPSGLPTDRVFPMSPNALRLSWERLKRRSGIVDLRFHDLRHEAISRFFEAGLSVPEVALISGHKEPRMLFRYTHLKAENVAARLGNVRDDGVA